VLHGINLDIEKGDFVALMGPSGSGKTTLLNLIGGLDSPSGGEIEVDGQRIDTLSSGQLSQWRSNHVGFVFQFYNLMPTLSAQKNVELPLLLTSCRPRSASATPRSPCSWSAWPIAASTGRRNCRAASSSASPSRARSCPTRRC
jgi:ABC-type lipoprotein export system ATPase subunit